MIPGKVRIAAGWLLVVPFLVLARPTPALLVGGAALAGLGLVVRAWAAGHLDKGGALTTSGPYAHTRNPLYVGSFLVGVGLSVAGGHWIWPALFAGLFFVVYVPTMRAEARELTARHGERFVDYARAVPAFVPRPAQRYQAVEEEGSAFRWSRYRRYREWEAALGVVAVLAVLTARWALAF